MIDGSVKLELSKAEALVLFEWLARREQAAGRRQPDAAEQNVLWSMEVQLEKTLVEPFARDYDRQLASARAEAAGEELDQGAAPDTKRHRAHQRLLPILRNPDQVDLQIELRVRA
jgi:hypothetical protein